MLRKYHNNSILTTNSKTKNKIANSRLIDYTKEIAIDEDKAIIEEDHVTAEKLICHLIVKRFTIYIANQDISPINIFLTNNNNYKRDLKTDFNLI